MKMPEEDTWNEKFKKSGDIDYTIERGLKKNQLHIHIMFKIRHFTKIQLKLKIKYVLNQDLIMLMYKIDY